MMPRPISVLRVASIICAVMTTPIIAAAQSFAVDSAPCAARATALAPTSPLRDSTRARAADSSSTRAAVVVFAAASAREVTFAKAPEIRVRLCGGLDSLRVVERRNLPNPVVVGRTYRDVYVAVEIFGRINADCIVAALTSTPRDSTGQRNACASLEVSGTRTKPPERR
jgi:hypothetical protein